MVRKLATREALGTTILKENKEYLNKISAETKINKSLLVDEALELLKKERPLKNS